MPRKEKKAYKTNASVLFLDIRNFTNLTDLLTPKLIAAILDNFYSDIKEIIKKNNGKIDKYIGDAVMAVFSGDNHCADALKAACSIIKNTAHKKYYDFELRTGIGIASGDMLSISLVNSPRTVLGSSVNLAARLETLTKKFNAQLLIDDTTFNEIDAQTKSKFCFLPITNLIIRGIYTPITIYMIMPEKKDLEKIFINAVDLFNERKFENAISKFSELLAEFKNKGIPTEIITKHYLSRALEGMAHKNQFFADPMKYDSYSKTQFMQANRLLTVIEQILPSDFMPENILDIGCGSGSFTKIIADKYSKSKIEGIDISQQMIEHVKSKFKEDKYRFSELDIEDDIERIKSKLANHKYDLIVSNSALHWAIDQNKVYKNIAELLSDSGWVCIHQGGYGTYSELRELAITLLQKKGILKQKFKNFQYPARYLNEEELKKVLRKSGLEVISVIGKNEKASASLPQDFANAGLLPYLEPLNYAEKQCLKENFINEANRILEKVTIHRLYAIARKKPRCL